MKDEKIVQRWMDIHDKIVDRHRDMKTGNPQLTAALILLTAVIQEQG
tara:strand:+ start:5386 stop:5526 length:141 start_codon:yes stop_codon:yes gene_type:complete